MSYWLTLSVYPGGRSDAAGFTSHDACWHELPDGSRARTSARPTASSATTIAAIAILRVVRPSSGSLARSWDGRGRGGPGAGSGRGRLLVIAAQDALCGSELPERACRRRRRERSGSPPTSPRADPVVLRVVLQLHEAERLEERRQID